MVPYLQQNSKQSTQSSTSYKGFESLQWRDCSVFLLRHRDCRVSIPRSHQWWRPTTPQNHKDSVVGMAAQEQLPGGIPGAVPQLQSIHWNIRILPTSNAGFHVSNCI